MQSRGTKNITKSRWTNDSHLLYYLSKITDISSGVIDEFNVSALTLPNLLARIQNDCKIMDILAAKRYVKKLKEYTEGLEKKLKFLENIKRNV